MLVNVAVTDIRVLRTEPAPFSDRREKGGASFNQTEDRTEMSMNSNYTHVWDN